MNKKRRWFFALLLALGMCLGMSVSVWAETYTSGDYEYQVNDDGTATITEYNGEGGAVTIPGTLDDYTVTKINHAFYDCSGLASVNIPAARKPRLSLRRRSAFPA